jgi:hypothetical protein
LKGHQPADQDANQGTADHLRENPAQQVHHALAFGPRPLAALERTLAHANTGAHGSGHRCLADRARPCAHVWPGNELLPAQTPDRNRDQQSYQNERQQGRKCDHGKGKEYGHQGHGGAKEKNDQKADQGAKGKFANDKTKALTDVHEDLLAD